MCATFISSRAEGGSWEDTLCRTTPLLFSSLPQGLKEKEEEHLQLFCAEILPFPAKKSFLRGGRSSSRGRSNWRRGREIILHGARRDGGEVERERKRGGGLMRPGLGREGRGNVPFITVFLATRLVFC